MLSDLLISPESKQISSHAYDNPDLNWEIVVSEPDERRMSERKAQKVRDGSH
jgi:hypothetical protein